MCGNEVIGLNNRNRHKTYPQPVWLH